MAIEVSSDRTVCSMCGMAYSKWRNNFPVCNGGLYKGSGHLPYCKKCVDRIYKACLKECSDPEKAIRQVCRRLDLYWSDNIYKFVDKKDVVQNLLQIYLKRLNAAAYAGKTYGDTLEEEGNLWNFVPPPPVDDSMIAIAEKIIEDNARAEEDAKRMPEVSEDVIAFWGSGYQPYMYAELEQRRKYWMASFPEDIELDATTEATIRQICSMELDINKARAAGKNVDKSVATLNSLIGALNSAQSKYEDTSLGKTPIGVMAKIIEQKHPIAEPSEKYKDVDGIGRYINTWFLGHAGKMLGESTVHTRLYDEAIAKLRIEHPELDDVDDDELVASVFDPGGDENE